MSVTDYVIDLLLIAVIFRQVRTHELTIRSAVLPLLLMAVAAAVVRDDAVPVLGQEQHLAVPGVGVERPAVRERYDRPVAPVLVVDLGAILGGDRAHNAKPFLVPMSRLSRHGRS